MSKLRTFIFFGTPMAGRRSFQSMRVKQLVQG